MAEKNSDIKQIFEKTFEGAGLRFLLRRYHPELDTHWIGFIDTIRTKADLIKEKERVSKEDKEKPQQKNKDYLKALEEAENHVEIFELEYQRFEVALFEIEQLFDKRVVILKEISDLKDELKKQKNSETASKIQDLLNEELNTVKVIDQIIQDNQEEIKETKQLVLSTKTHSKKILERISEKLNDLLEQSVKFPHLKEWMEEISRIKHATEGLEKDSLGPVPFFPIVTDFVQGFLSIYDAYHAHQKPTGQRKTRIGTSLLTAGLFLGGGIVGSIFLAGVGALATTTAILATPIVLAAVPIIAYTVMAFRHFYIERQTSKMIKSEQQKTTTIATHLERLKSNAVHKFLNTHPNMKLEKIKELQELIDKTKDSHKKNKLIIERNLLIDRDYDLKDLRKYMNQDPAILRAAIRLEEQNNVLSALQKENISAKKRVGFSIVNTIAAGFAMAAAVAVIAFPPAAIALVATAITIAGLSMIVSVADRKWNILSKIGNGFKKLGQLFTSSKDEAVISAPAIQPALAPLPGNNIHHVNTLEIDEKLAIGKAGPVEKLSNADKKKVEEMLDEQIHQKTLVEHDEVPEIKPSPPKYTAVSPAPEKEQAQEKKEEEKHLKPD